MVRKVKVVGRLDSTILNAENEGLKCADFATLLNQSLLPSREPRMIAELSCLI